MSGGGIHRLGESALDRARGVEEGDVDWERAHLIGPEWFGGGKHRLGESALDRARGVEEVTDLEKAHLRVEGNEWRETPTGRGRT